MTPLTHLFISKNRKVLFDITVVIRDLVNVPLVSGLFFVTWRIKHASQQNGTTLRAPIKNHAICWNQSVKVHTQLVISKQKLLGACELKLEVFQEIGGKQISSIGDLSINLSEYVDNGMNTERFLLHNTKFNSTMKLAIRMTQVSDPGMAFDVPMKKKALATTIPSFISERKTSAATILDGQLQGIASTGRKPAANRLVRRSQSTMTLVTPAKKKKKKMAHSCLPFFFL
ncbi:N-terminal C2 in EEIG1 and EHBP1 proteins-domain-containing protein [Gongronella butleri]|nr:N-terminal C2 in EEIG1 and EHBP1 proteins-domain-containing protein [Gongronella butleri]